MVARIHERILMIGDAYKVQRRCKMRLRSEAQQLIDNEVGECIKHDDIL